MRQTGAMKHPSTALRQTMKNRFLSPVTRVFRKRFLTTCLTTDSRGVCGNSGVKSCEEHSQQSKNGYKASEKVKKLLFKSLGPSGREFESPISDHKRNLFCLPRQERFFLAFWAKYKANHRKMGFGAVDRLLRSPFFAFSGRNSPKTPVYK